MSGLDVNVMMDLRHATLTSGCEDLPPWNDALLDNYTDAELVKYVKQSPSLVTTRQEAVVTLSSNLVAKPVYFDVDYRDEVAALERARAIGIRVPTVRRVVPADDEEQHYLIMDRVHGSTLEQLWPRLGWWDTFCVARQLRSFLHIMASVTSQTTGGLHSGQVRSEWLQALYGPIPNASPSDFAGYLNWWLLECRPYRYKARPDLVLNAAREHILVHQDLAPRNMILDAHKRLWLIDWGRAGFYPAYMEYLAIEPTAMPWINARTWVGWWGRVRWSFLRWVACGAAGPYEKAGRALSTVHDRSVVFRLDRTPYSMRK
ncbi:kinase-like protein [Amylostereum chailletii]|nr:kinase-like protein [Amylostereum chailletii]